MSGHYFFTLGRHCRDYRYDPQLYFAGDEISLSIRSFTAGYDLYHPHRNLLWHQYLRRGQVKHWDDHTIANREVVGTVWSERDAVSKRRLRRLLREEENGEDITGFDLADIRTHHEYERYAGIDFKNRALHRQAVLGVDPPCRFLNDEDWLAFTSHYEIELHWKIEDIQQCDDCAFVYFGIEDNRHKVLYRYDAYPDSHEGSFATEQKILSLQTHSRPTTLVVWPYSKSGGWQKKVTYPVRVRKVK